MGWVHKRTLRILREKRPWDPLNSYEKPIMTDVVQVRESGALAAGPFLARRRDLVPGDQLPVNIAGVLSRRDDTSHVEPVPMPKILYGHLLNESLDRGRFTTILHTANYEVPSIGTDTRAGQGVPYVQAGIRF